MWISYLQKHFTDRRWKKYYQKITFYLQCICFGLKPSFMWDFGPATITPQQLSHFLQDLKKSSLICDDIIVITIDDNVFIANTYYLLESLKGEHIFVDITKSEREWVTHTGNNFLMDVIESLKSVEKCSANCIFALPLTGGDCLPSIFGLLLGYPLVYYFNLNYPNFSLCLVLYRVVCRFNFLGTSHEFEISSFSIPETLYNNGVECAVYEWFDTLRTVNAVMFQDLKIQCSREYVNSLNL